MYAAGGQLREMVVNVGLGLGEGIVSGTVDVDHVLVSKNGDLEPGDLQLRYRVGDKREQVVFDGERGTGTKREETRYHQRFRAGPGVRGAVRAGARGLPGWRRRSSSRSTSSSPSRAADLLILQARPIPLFDAAWRETLARHPLRPPGLEKEASMIRKDDALRYHSGDRPGKVEVKATKPCLSPREIRLAYLPGATFPASEIAADAGGLVPLHRARKPGRRGHERDRRARAWERWARRRPSPSRRASPSCSRRLADIDVFDLEIDTATVDDFTSAVRMLEPTFGGINLKDIRAPEGLAIYDRLVEAMRIPVFHENLYGTAVVATGGPASTRSTWRASGWRTSGWSSAAPERWGSAARAS